MQFVYARGLSHIAYNVDLPIYVNSCGYYRDVSADINISRPEGKDNYHILLASSGKIHVNGEELTAGKAYLFYPSSPQYYSYESGEGSEYYWIHFSGKIVPEIIESYGIREGLLDLGASRGEFERMIKMMIRAISENFKYTDDYCGGLLSSMLALVAAPPVISSPYHKAVKILSDPANNQSVEEIAAIYNMSSNHFIRSFKQYVGLSPNAFRIAKRMEIACEMLTSTDMSVESIAGAAGYDDSLYFSRAFKKQEGMSPSEYRKMKKALN